jgi:putative phage-type endonuclease
MKILNIDQNTDEWLEARRGKITGSKLGDIVVKRGNGYKQGFYQLIADRVFDGAASEQDDRDRGHSLEQEAAERFEHETKLKCEKVGLVISDISDDIALSPDRLVKTGKKYTDGVEIKCLSDARHIEAVLTDAVPDTYLPQVMQYFVVINDLERVHLVFYSDRTTIKKFQYHCVVVNRVDYEALIEFYRDYQLRILSDVKEILEEYTF